MSFVRQSNRFTEYMVLLNFIVYGAKYSIYLHSAVYQLVG